MYKTQIRYCFRGITAAIERLTADIWQSRTALHMLCVFVEFTEGVCIQSADIIKHVHGLHLCTVTFYAYIIQDLYCLVVTSGPADPGCICDLHLQQIVCLENILYCIPFNNDMWHTSQPEWVWKDDMTL